MVRDPYARWCGRGGVARRPPIPINYHYLACWPDVGALGMFMALLCRKAGLATIELPTEVRLRRRGDLIFAFNYGRTPWRAPFSDKPLLGELKVMPRNFTVWRS